MIPVIVVDLDGTLYNSEFNKIYTSVAVNAHELAISVGVPLIVVTGRSSNPTVKKETVKLVSNIKDKTGADIKSIILGREQSESLPDFKVRVLKQRDLKPLVMIDDVDEVLDAMNKEFGSVGIKAKYGELTRVY